MRGFFKRLLGKPRDGSVPEIIRGAGHPAISKIEAAMSGLLPVEAESYVAHIEALRTELLLSDAPLTWDRPWLAGSEELRSRMKANPSDERYPSTITTSAAAKVSRSPQDCRSLMALTLAFQPANALEMGTNVGISGASIASALAINGRGKLVTLEGAAMKCDLARANFERLKLDRVEVIAGDFAETLDEALARLNPLDLAFIDGFHDSDATIRYHGLCKAAANTGAVLVYDDITWSDGMRRAWREIANDTDVALSMSFGNIGVCVLA